MMMDIEEESEPVPYIGDSPFTFISYSHKDRNRILPILKTLEANNILFWYDKAICHGEYYREIIANRIKKCKNFIAFITFSSISSSWVKKECNKADDENSKRKKKLIPIYLDPVALSEGLDMVFSGIHAFFKNDVEKPDFYEKLLVNIENTKNNQFPNSKNNDLISFYNHEHSIAGLTTRKFIHEMPLWHETVIILVIYNNVEIILQQKPLRSRIGRGKIGTFGGHVKYGESYTTASIREATEELGFESGMIKEEELILVGKLGDFRVKKKYKKNKEILDDKEEDDEETQIYYNYEFSSVYCYFLKEGFTVNAQENFDDIENKGVIIMNKSLSSIQKDFKENPDNYADGLSRILKNKETINEIEQIMSNR